MRGWILALVLCLPMAAEARAYDLEADECDQVIGEIMSEIEKLMLDKREYQTCEDQIESVRLIEIKRSLITRECSDRLTFIGKSVLSVNFDEFACSAMCDEKYQAYFDKVVTVWSAEREADDLAAEALQIIEEQGDKLNWDEIELRNDPTTRDRIIDFCERRETLIETSIRLLREIADCFTSQDIRVPEVVNTEIAFDQSYRSRLLKACGRVYRHVALNP